MIKTKISELLKIKSVEFRNLLLFCLINALLTGGVVVGSSAITSMTLIKYGAGILPFLFIAVSLATLAVTPVYLKFISKFDNEKYFVILQTLCAVIIFILYFFLSINGVYIFLYIIMEIAVFLTFSQFSNLIYDYFDTQQSKRLFPLIATGGSLGGIAAGLLVKKFVELPSFTSNELLVAWAIILAAPIFAIKFLDKKKAGIMENKKTKKIRKNMLPFFLRMKKEFSAYTGIPLARIIIITSILMVLCTYFLDFESSRLLRKSFSDKDELTGFLSFFSSLSYFITIIIQSFIINRLILWIGVVNAGYIFPAAVLASFIGLLFYPCKTSAVFALFTRRYLKSSVHAIISDLLLNGITSKLKSKFRGIIKGYVIPSSTLAASIAIFAINSYFNSAFLNIAGIILSIFFIISLFYVKRAYIASLQSIMLENSMSLDSELKDIAGQAAIAFKPENILNMLERSGETESLIIIDSVMEIKSQEITEILKKIYNEKSKPVKVKIISAVEKMSPGKNFHFLSQSYNCDDEELKQHIVKYLTDYIPGSIFDLLLNFDSKPIEIKKNVIYVLCKSDYIKTFEFGIIELFKLDLDDSIDIITQLGGKKYIYYLNNCLITEKTSKTRIKLLSAMEYLEDGLTDEYEKLFLSLFESQENCELERNIIFNALAKFGSNAVMNFLFEKFDILNFEQKIIYIKKFSGSNDYSKLKFILNDESQSYQILYETVNLLKNFDFEFLQNFMETSLSRIDELQIYYGIAKYLKAVYLIELSILELIQIKIKLCCLILSVKTNRWKIVNDSIEKLFSGDRNLRANAVETISNVVEFSEFTKLNAILEKLFSAEVDVVDSAELKDFLFSIFKQNKWFTGISVFYLKKENVKLLPEELMMIKNLSANKDIYIAESYNYYFSMLKKYQLSVFDEMILLRNVPIFKDLDLNGLKLLGIMADEIFINKDEKIFSEGDKGEALYIIAEGKIRIYKENKGEIALLSEKNYFGEFAVLSSEKRMASAIAVEDTLLIRITKEKFMQLLQKYPVIIFPIFQNLIRKILERGSN